MKKIVSTFILTLLGCGFALAQGFVVSGTVLDSLTREGEPAAVLQFFKSSDLDKPVAFTTTGTDGTFTQTLTGRGGYRLLFSNMGRKTVTRDFTYDGSSQTVDLGTILVQDDVQTLKAGTVTAQRPLVKMEVDKMTYDVANDVDSKTSTVLDMLPRSLWYRLTARTTSPSTEAPPSRSMWTASPTR